MTKIPSVKIRNHYMCRAGHRGKYKNWQHQDGSFGSTIQKSLKQKEEIFRKRPIQVSRVQLQGPAPGSRVGSHPPYSGSPTQHEVHNVDSISLPTDKYWHQALQQSIMSCYKWKEILHNWNLLGEAVNCLHIVNLVTLDPVCLLNVSV